MISARLQTLAILGCVVSASVAVAVAQQTPAERFEAQKIQHAWTVEIDGIEELIASGESKAAYRRSSKLLKRMREQLVGSKAAAPLLTSALVARAVAAYESDPDEAIWHWQVAQQLRPELQHATLSDFGPTGEALSEHRVREPIDVAQKRTPEPDRSSSAPAHRRSKFEPPVPVHRTVPLAGVSRPQSHTQIEVQYIIDREGKVREPRILSPVVDPALTYIALEALRQWRYRPGEVDGTKTEVMYTSTIAIDFR